LCCYVCMVAWPLTRVRAFYPFPDGPPNHKFVTKCAVRPEPPKRAWLVMRLSIHSKHVINP
jgi:hypothetical protein